MAQHTILLSIPQVKVSQLSPSSTTQSSLNNDHSESILFSSTTLNVQLLDIPSNALKSIPSSSDPPSYADLSKQATLENSSSITLETWLVISLADSLVEIPIYQSSKVTCPSHRTYLVPILPGDHTDQELKKKTENSAYIKLEIASSVSDDTLETLDSILSSWSHFSAPDSPNSNLSTKQTTSKAPYHPPPPSHPSTSFLTSNSGPPPPVVQNNGPSQSSFPSEGRLALMDESTGEICGELDSNVQLQAHVSQHSQPYAQTQSNLTPQSGQHPPHQPLLAAAQPVIVNLTPSNSNSSHATTAEITLLPAEDRSQILEGAEWISRGILAGSEVISALIAKSGNTYLSRSQPTTVPMTFSPTTHSSVDKVLGYTRTASKVSGKTAAIVGNILVKVGDSIGKSTGIQRAPNGALPTGTRGYVHKSLHACNTVLNSIETGAKNVFSTAGDTTTNLVTHTYGPEAGNIARRSKDAVRNVALVYIDARGVTRRAILKSVGKAAIKGQMNDGREVIFTSDSQLDDWVNVENQTAGPPQSKSVDPSQFNNSKRVS